MFCIKCGSDAFAENLCERHYLESKNLFSVSDFQLNKCRMCGEAPDLEDAIKDRTETEYGLDSVKFDKKRIGSMFEVSVTGSGKIPPSRKTVKKTKTIRVKFTKRLCDRCVKVSGGYYEAVIQVRGPDRERILDRVGKLSPKKAIGGIEENKHGYNVKFISKKNANKIAHALSKKYDVKDSYKLVGTKKGKRLYRNYYVVR